MHWLIENYTVIVAYVGLTAFGWWADYRIGLALAVLLPLAFILGRGSAGD